MLRSSSTPAVAAAVIIAHQVAGKAARDALFLSHFDVTRLPLAIVACSLLAGGCGVWFGRVIQRRSPLRVLPAAFGVSGFLLALTPLLLRVNPSAAALLLFLQMNTLGPLLISGFWSVMSEVFDPHAARSQFGRAGAGANAGGFIGGVLACGFAASAHVSEAILLLAALHACAGLLLFRLGSSGAGRVAMQSSFQCETSGIRLVARVPHLRNLGFVVLGGTVSAALVDYVFKARASAAFVESGELLRFFSLFYLCASLMTLVIQASFTRRALQRLGLHGAAASLPAAVLAGSAGALLAPGLATAALTRAGESVLRSSLFRSSYELFYVPLGDAERRATKPVIDVCVEKAGDAIGAIAIQCLLLLGAHAALKSMSCAAIVVASSSLFAASRLRSGYVAALERSLLADPHEHAAKTESCLMEADRASLPGLSVLGLTRDLFNQDFHVRVRSALELANIKRRIPQTDVNATLVLEAVIRELSVAADAPPTLLVEHVFRLLPLALPGDAMRVACEVLLTGDACRSGAAVEYLETTLPPRVWLRLRPLVERKDYMEVSA